MYRNVIEIRKDVPEEKLKTLVAMAEREFNNRAGMVRNTSKMPYQLVFEGGEEKWGCLNLGVLGLWDRKDFVSLVQKWDWIDEEEPGESCDVIKEMSIPIKIS